MKKNLFVFIILNLFFLSVCGLSDRVYVIETRANFDIPTKNFEEVWNMVSEDEKLFLTKKVGEAVKSAFPPNISDRVRSRDAGIVEDVEYLSDMSEFIDCFPEDAPKGTIGDFFIKKAMGLLEKMDKNMLVRVNPEIFKFYHKIVSFSVFDKFKEEWRETLPAFIPQNFDIFKTFEFAETNEGINTRNMPQTKFNSLFNYNGREFGTYNYIIDYPDYTKYNSKRFSDLLNQLSNNDSEGKVYGKVDLRLGNNTFNVASGEELIDVLYRHEDYDVVLYEARALVSFGGLSMRQGDVLVPIEFPFYVKTRFDKEDLYVPMNHSEHIIAVYKKGNDIPLAVTKWYMAMGPDKNNRQGAYFEEALVGGPHWTGYKITHIYEKPENIKKFISMTTYFQKFVNYVQKAYNFPDLGYGVLAVCNDSTSIMEVALSGKSSYSSIPNLRAVKFDYLYKNFMNRISNGLKYNSKGYLNVVSDAYTDVYSVNRQEYIKRISMSIPFRATERLGDYRISRILAKLADIDSSYVQYLNYTYQD